VRNLAIEINDAGLVAADETGVVFSEPGYVLAEGNDFLVGAEAYAQARLKPLSTSFTHWSSLSIEPGSASVGGRRSTAELAFAQLSRLWHAVGGDVNSVIFVVPSTYDSQVLGVLLGIAEECGIPTGAIVDVAAAASARPFPERQLLYVDADLHSVYVTPLEQGQRVTAAEPARLDSMGLHRVMDALARRIGELFVLETRFDPFHEARTEQLIYDALPDAVRRLDRSEKTRFAIERGSEQVSVEIETGQLFGAALGFCQAVRQLIAQNRHDRSGLVVQLSDRLMSLPGIELELARLDAASIVELEPGFAARSVLEAADALALEAESVTLFRHLPWRGPPVQLEAERAGTVDRRPPQLGGYQCPTHVVYRGIAYPVNGDGLVIGRSKFDQRPAIIVEAETQGVSRAHCELAIEDGELKLRDLSSYGTFVNERRVEGDEVLKPADTIRVGSPGAELTVIRVEDHNGA